MKLGESGPGTYLIYDKISGRYYVGSAADAYDRQQRHEAALRRGDHKNKPLQEAYNQSGCQNFDEQFTFTFTPTETREEAYAFEKAILDEFFDSGLLFNRSPLVKGITNGEHLSEEHKKKIGLANKGKQLSPKQIERLRLLHTGVVQSEETKEKRRQSMLGKNVGKSHTEEAKAKMSESHTGKVLAPEHRAKIAAAGIGRTNTPEVIENMRLAALARARRVSVDGVVYESIRAAANAFGISDATARDRINSTTGKFTNWQWA